MSRRDFDSVSLQTLKAWRSSNDSSQLVVSYGLDYPDRPHDKGMTWDDIIFVRMRHTFLRKMRVQPLSSRNDTGQYTMSLSI